MQRLCKTKMGGSARGACASAPHPSKLLALPPLSLPSSHAPPQLVPATLSRVDVKRAVPDAKLASDVSKLIKKFPSTFVFWKPEAKFYSTASVTPIGPNNGSVPFYPCYNAQNQGIPVDLGPQIQATHADQLGLSPVTAAIDTFVGDYS